MKKATPVAFLSVITLLAGCSIDVTPKTTSSVTPSKEESTVVASSSQEVSVSSSQQESSSKAASSVSTSVDPEYVDPEKWTLNWSDEFDGTSLNKSYWEPQIGDGSDYGVYQWGNSEQQYYKEENATVADGALTITAKIEQTGNYKYTSARLRTKGKVFTKYGRIEAKMQLPAVRGCWPAFWMLPENNYMGQGWPYSGEIDIMENKGRQSKITSGALHYSDNGGHTYRTNTATLSSSIQEWHVYALEWSSEEMRWFVDGKQFLLARREYWHPVGSVYPTDDDAPFNQDFHILLNLAIGGHFDNYQLPPDNMLPASMKVDYVRIYKAVEK